MKTIDVRVNKAKILSYAVDLKEDGTPDVAATIGLYAGEKKISTFRLCTQHWYGDSIEFKLPVGMIDPIVSISRQLETILVQEFNRSLMRLPGNTVDAEVLEN